MRERLLRIGVVVAVLFVVNAVARLIGRFAYGDGTAEHEAALDRLQWIGWGVIALTMAVAAGWWIRHRVQGAVAIDLLIAGGAAGLLFIIIGPFLSAPPRFEDGLGGSIVLLTVYLAVAGVGALIGALSVVALGKDFQSRQLEQYAKSRESRPRRV